MTVKFIKRRKVLFSVITILVFLAFAFSLIKIQGVDGEYYSSLKSYTSTHTLTVDATRGAILDANGNPIVKNRSGNELVFIVGQFPSVAEQETRNKVLLSLINLMDEQGEKRNDTIPLVLTETGVEFAERSSLDIRKLKQNLGLESDATAQECFDAAIKKFKLQSYPREQAIEIASVCNYMINMDYSSSNPYVFASDVDSVTASIVKENSGYYKGVEVNVVSYREYVSSDLAVHVIGPVGAISEEEYELLKDQGYSIDDEIGKSGIEQAYESYLRGTDGKITVTTLSDGTTTREYSVQPQHGHSVKLTIDSGIQRATQQALEDTIMSLREKAQNPNNTTIGDVTGGAAVVINVKTGAILASASYPSYDLEEYFSDYSNLASAPNSPLWNRAALSTYAPGSTLKPLVSLAALQSGTINEYSSVYCQRVYTYYQNRGLLLYCMHAHGWLNVTGAIYESCNCFYYEVGRNLGIGTINEYMEKFGLAQKTGSELSEAQGVMAGPAYRETLGQYWYEADTSQAAIGQSDNMFTVLQLANYAATIANGGTRYQLHYVDSIISADGSEVIYSHQPTVLATVDASEYNFDIVRYGMKLVGTQGVVGNVMRGLPVDVAGKTGSAQVNNQLANGFFISFAPFDDPEIAVAVCIEQAGSGSSVSPVAKGIYEYYFVERFAASEEQDENTLLQ
ncbi:MAG: hypothetical protein IKY44_04550 [Clostridia bacterium]|nr:hypothetical protein [Clostridia bacterium]